MTTTVQSVEIYHNLGHLMARLHHPDQKDTIVDLTWLISVLDEGSIRQINQMTETVLKERKPWIMDIKEMC